MQKGRRTLLVLSLCSTLIGCTGMHMSSNLTPSINAQGEIVTPEIQPITAELIQKQQRIAAETLARQIADYQKPEGFKTNTRGYEYKVGPQDVLSIIIWDHPNLSNPMNTQNSNPEDAGITVDAQGYIFYPYVGKVKVAGLSVNEIRNTLARKLSKYIKQPQINVRVVGFHSQKIDITGTVRSPQVIPVTNIPVTVLNAITQAGGPVRCGIQVDGSTQQLCADLQHVEVERKGQKTQVNLDTLKAVDGSPVNWILQGGDSIYVPNNNRYRVFVLGAVNQAGPFNMIDGHMTLRELISDAKGITYGAAPEYTYVIRSYKKNPQIYSINLRSPDSLILAGEFELKPEDVVFVSTSNLENFFQVMRQITPAMTAGIFIKSITN